MYPARYISYLILAIVYYWGIPGTIEKFIVGVLGQYASKVWSNRIALNFRNKSWNNTNSAVLKHRLNTNTIEPRFYSIYAHRKNGVDMNPVKIKLL